MVQLQQPLLGDGCGLVAARHWSHRRFGCWLLWIRSKLPWARFLGGLRQRFRRRCLTELRNSISRASIESLSTKTSTRCSTSERLVIDVTWSSYRSQPLSVVAPTPRLFPANAARYEPLGIGTNNGRPPSSRSSSFSFATNTRGTVPIHHHRCRFPSCSSDCSCR